MNKSMHQDFFCMVTHFKILSIVICVIMTCMCTLFYVYVNRSLLFLLTIPTCIAVGFIFFIGRDVKNVKLYYHSSDKGSLFVLI